MKNIYTWNAQPAERNLTIADMRSAKGKRQFVQTKVATAVEAAAAGEAGLDMLICTSPTVEDVRRGNDTLFLTATIAWQNFVTGDDILREAFKALAAGADALLTARSLDVVSLLAKEDIPVMGHLGLVPRKSTWTGGLRAVGKTANEAFELYQQFRRLEDAGAALVEVEVVPAPVMAEISKRTGLITVSLGAGAGADVIHCFIEDLTGENPNPPRHARAFGDLARLHRQIETERLAALKAYREAVRDGSYPADGEMVTIDEDELSAFLDQLES
ncbi:MAG TPA: ketopantoate hydroxymethyltransferase [Rhodospirillaceae bacterium]|nr:ketopantoate hydroxymethyltransferase [Rhodospirillaceae bacterium]HAT34355.1 ketopantoate hydroxymethyltransferase [Rhodospirillaceae bacterium]